MAIYDLMKLYFDGNQRLLPVHLYGSRETGKAGKGKGGSLPKGFYPFKQLSYNTILWGSIRASFCARMRRTKYLSNSSRYQQNRFG